LLQALSEETSVQYITVLIKHVVIKAMMLDTPFAVTSVLEKRRASGHDATERAKQTFPLWFIFFSICCVPGLRGTGHVRYFVPQPKGVESFNKSEMMGRLEFCMVKDAWRR
jgi:hypothetical protein